MKGNTLVAVPVRTGGPEFEAGLPAPLFDKLLPAIRRNRYVPSCDGLRFLMVTPPEDRHPISTSW